MMNFNAVSGIVFRHLYNFKHNFERITDAFYWPAMDIFLWGFTSVYITKQAGNVPQIILILLSGLILWQVVWRGQYEITVNLLEEMWNTNLVNLFASPLRVREWVTGVFILGFLKLLVSLSFAMLLALFLYKANIFTLGFYLIPFIVSLLLTGWAVGLIVSALIIYFGIKIQTFAWGGVFLLAPFSGIYYPISTLPIWAQKVASFLPTSYVFEGMREVIFKGSLSAIDLIKSFMLNGVFLVIGVLFFNFMFTKSKEKGLARLE
jgi:ABC-2 type transport system permease protein